MLDEMSVFCWAELWNVWIWRATTVFLFSTLWFMDCVILRFRTDGLRYVIYIIGLLVHGLYKYSEFGNLLVNFYFTYGISIRRSFKLSSDDTVFLN